MELNSPLSSQTSLLSTMNNCASSDIDNFKTAVSSQISVVNDSVHVQFNDVVSILNVQSSLIDNVKSTSTNQLTDVSDNMLAHLDELKQSLDL